MKENGRSISPENIGNRLKGVFKDASRSAALAFNEVRNLLKNERGSLGVDPSITFLFSGAMALGFASMPVPTLIGLTHREITQLDVGWTTSFLGLGVGLLIGGLSHQKSK